MAKRKVSKIHPPEHRIAQGLHGAVCCERILRGGVFRDGKQNMTHVHQFLPSFVQGANNRIDYFLFHQEGAGKPHPVGLDFFENVGPRIHTRFSGGGHFQAEIDIPFEKIG